MELFFQASLPLRILAISPILNKNELGHVTKTLHGDRLLSESTQEVNGK